MDQKTEKLVEGNAKLGSFLVAGQIRWEVGGVLGDLALFFRLRQALCQGQKATWKTKASGQEDDGDALLLLLASPCRARRIASHGMAWHGMASSGMGWPGVAATRLWVDDGKGNPYRSGQNLENKGELHTVHSARRPQLPPLQFQVVKPSPMALPGWPRGGDLAFSLGRNSALVAF